MRKKFSQIAKELEKKPSRLILKISLVTFLVGLLVGFSSGLFFRELRLNLLSARQRAQKNEENRQINNLFEKFSQKKQQ